jgi:uncharacterized protein YkwD
MILGESEANVLIRFFLFLLFLYGLNLSWPMIENHMKDSNYGPIITNVQSGINELKENPEVLATVNSLYQDVLHILRQLDLDFEQLPVKEQSIDSKMLEAPDLTPPTEGQIFSINNVQIGDTKEELQHNLGEPKRISQNEYGLDWHTYHENYHHFFMLSYDENNKVVGLYTNQDLISSANGIKRGTSKEEVRKQLGEPLTNIQKGIVRYQYKDDEYDLFLKDHVYITVFYDQHQDNTVTALQMISKDLEQRKNGFYAGESQKLKEGFEYQLFDLTNSTRVNHGLSVLSWDEHVRKTAREHSLDMAENDYFDHTNLKGQSPFDRMEEDKVAFNLAGENLATGQFSSIFAHEGLMNSLGHRENILREDFEHLGVGVAFNEESQPYYTQNFFAD